MNRGQEDNNPCNVNQVGPVPWFGSIGTDGLLAMFPVPFWGWRSAVLNMATKIREKPLITIREFISEYAPKNENDTEEYIDFVVKRVTVGWEREPATKQSRLSHVNTGELLEAMAWREGWYAKPSE